MMLGRLGGHGFAKVATRTAEAFSQLGDGSLSALTPAQLGTFVLRDLGLFTMIAGPIALTAASVSVFATISQTGFVFATEAFRLRWENLNPVNGLGRLKPSQSGLDLVKAALAALAVVALAFSVVRTVVADSPRLTWLSPTAAALE